MARRWGCGQISHSFRAGVAIAPLTAAVGAGGCCVRPLVRRFVVAGSLAVLQQRGCALEAVMLIGRCVACVVLAARAVDPIVVGVSGQLTGPNVQYGAQ